MANERCLYEQIEFKGCLFHFSIVILFYSDLLLFFLFCLEINFSFFNLI
jgi:hypothetical protein